MLDLSLTRSLEAWNTENFIETFEEEIAEKSQVLPLEEYQIHGGSIDWHDVTVEALQHCEPVGDTISGCFFVSFSESYHAGCRDMTWTVHFYGQVFFKFNFVTAAFFANCGDIEQVSDDDDEVEPE